MSTEEQAKRDRRRLRLLELPGYYINLDKSPERKLQFIELVGYAWKGPLTWVAGVDGSKIPAADVVKFIDSRRKHAGKPTKDVYPPQTMRIGAGSLGCLRGHISALRSGLEDGHERFIVFEDDAALRDSVLQRTPEPEADFVAWGGLVMLGFKSDDQLFANGVAQDWLPLSSSSRFYGAHAYELTRKVAEKLLAIYEKEEQTTDDGWHQLFDDVNAVRARVQVVTQKSGTTSMINNKKRETGAI